MATIAEMREGLRVRLATIEGLNAYARQPRNPQSPAAAVRLVRWHHHESFGGARTYTFDVWLYLNAADIDQAQQDLDTYLSDEGANSISVAIEADPTLGGLVQDTTVTGGDIYGLDNTGSQQPLAAAVTVEVLA